LHEQRIIRRRLNCRDGEFFYPDRREDLLEHAALLLNRGRVEQRGHIPEE
jgi:hypothetical protein